MSTSTQSTWYVPHSQDFQPPAQYMFEKHFHDARSWLLCCISPAPAPSAIALPHREDTKFRTPEIPEIWNGGHTYSYYSTFIQTKASQSKSFLDQHGVRWSSLVVWKWCWLGYRVCHNVLPHLILKFQELMFFLSMGFAQSTITCAGAPSSLDCMSLSLRVCVSGCFATMCLSADEYCVFSCCLLCVKCSVWAFLSRNSVVPMIFCAVTCRADTMIAFAFSAYWVVLILPCCRLVWSDWMACSALLAWSSRASENFSGWQYLSVWMSGIEFVGEALGLWGCYQCLAL